MTLRRTAGLLAALGATWLLAAPAAALADGTWLYRDAWGERPAHADILSTRVTHRPGESLHVNVRLRDLRGSGRLQVDVTDYFGSDWLYFRLHVDKSAGAGATATLQDLVAGRQVRCAIGVRWDAADDRVVARVPAACAPFHDLRWAATQFRHAGTTDVQRYSNPRVSRYSVRDASGDAAPRADVRMIRATRTTSFLQFTTGITNLWGYGRYVVQVRDSRMVVRKELGHAPVATLAVRREGRWTRSPCVPGLAWDVARDFVSVRVPLSCIDDSIGNDLSWVFFEAGGSHDAWWAPWR